MATNEILRFAETNTGTNLLTQAEYAADAQRTTGHQPGIARAKLENKALRQASLMSAGLAEFIADYQANNVTDALTTQNVADYLADAVRRAAFASGTRLMFPQSAAPTGWTRVTTDEANNRMLRVVSSGNGGTTGGSNSPILNNVVPAHTHGFSTGTESVLHSHSGSTGSISADHSHEYITPERLADNDRGGGSSTWSVDTSTTYATSGVSSNHVHAFATGGQNVLHIHSGSTDNGSSQTNWTPRYIDLILCVKN
jgi:hypothetical protein